MPLSAVFLKTSGVILPVVVTKVSGDLIFYWNCYKIYKFFRNVSFTICYCSFLGAQLIRKYVEIYL